MKILELHLNGNLMLLNVDNITCITTNFDGRDIPNITKFCSNELYTIRIEGENGNAIPYPLHFNDYSEYNACLKAIKAALISRTGLAFYDVYYTEVDEMGSPVDFKYNVIIKDGNLYEVY